MVKIAAIVAMNQERVIGNNAKLPWHIPEDMKRFSLLTKGQAVLMGRKTYESIPEKFRPLPNRKNIIATRSDNLELPEGVEVVSDIKTFLQQIISKQKKLEVEILWIIGGTEIYKQALEFCDEIYLTLVEGVHQGDTWFPAFEDRFKLTEKQAGKGFEFQIWKRE